MNRQVFKLLIDNNLLSFSRAENLHRRGYWQAAPIALRAIALGLAKIVAVSDDVKSFFALRPEDSRRSAAKLTSEVRDTVYIAARR